MAKPTPITIVCERFKCTEGELTTILGVVPSCISNWKMRRNGRIPELHYRKLLKEAKKRKVSLSLDELVVL